MLQQFKKCLKTTLAMFLASTSLVLQPNMILAREPLDSSALSESEDSFDSAALFEDASKMTLSPEYSSLEKVEQAYRAHASDPSALPDLQRALELLKGHHEKDYVRSTFPEGGIIKTGDMKDYCQNTLKYKTFSSNRQPLGLKAPSDTTITISATGIPEGKSIKVRFGQILNYWETYDISSGTTLKNGINTIKVPNYVQRAKNAGKLQEFVLPEMAIYLECPYTKDQMPEDFTLSFSGVSSYPIYHFQDCYEGYGGDSVEDYLDELHAYAQKVRLDPYSAVDMTEFVTKHLIITVRATEADKILHLPGSNLKRSLTDWDKMVEFMLGFDGVSFKGTLAEYAKQNYMIVQEWKGAGLYCASNLIGAYSGSRGEDQLIDCHFNPSTKKIGEKSNIDWGFIHELGHALDIPEREQAENTNNVFANAYNIVFNDAYRASDKDSYYDQVCKMEEPDYQDGSLWKKDEKNFLVFSQLVAYRPTFWGEFDNFLRDPKKYTSTIKSLSKSERFVYIASSIFNRDLSYWFEKFGFRLGGTGNYFTEDSMSQSFKDLMSELKARPDFKTDQLAFWLLDPKQYKLSYQGFIADHNENWGNLYGENGQQKQAPEIKAITLKNDKYIFEFDGIDVDQTLYIDVEVKKEDGSFERAGLVSLSDKGEGSLKKDQVQGETPIFRIKAIDRQLNWSDYSKEKSFIDSGESGSRPEAGPAARIGEQEFANFYDAAQCVLNHPKENITLELLRDCDITSGL